MAAIICSKFKKIGIINAKTVPTSLEWTVNLEIVARKNQTAIKKAKIISLKEKKGQIRKWKIAKIDWREIKARTDRNLEPKKRVGSEKGVGSKKRKIR